MVNGQVIWNGGIWSMVGLKFREDIVKKVFCLLAEGDICYIKMWVEIVNSTLGQAQNSEFLGRCWPFWSWWTIAWSFLKTLLYPGKTASTYTWVVNFHGRGHVLISDGCVRVARRGGRGHGRGRGVSLVCVRELGQNALQRFPLTMTPSGHGKSVTVTRLSL